MQINVRGNSATASKLKEARNIKLQGAVSGNINFDGSKNVTIETTQSNSLVLYIEGPEYKEGVAVDPNASVVKDLPDGWNASNCAIISCMSANNYLDAESGKSNLEDNYWSNYPSHTSEGQKGCYVMDNRVIINAAEILTMYRVVLMKIK